jgi:beta-lactamase class D
VRIALAAALAAAVAVVPGVHARAAVPRGSCFLLYEVGVGEMRRNPGATCQVRVSPQSTFKIPHALAALEAGVIENAETLLKYDGRPVDMEFWRRDHTLATAMKYSVVWYFQEVAKRLGAERERAFLEKFDYGNRDSSSGLTTFWLGGSLAISPEEQQRFLLRLFADGLPVTARASNIVRTILVQPRGSVVNALGEHPFAAPWPEDAVVSAKTGSGNTGDGSAVRWIVGHVARGPRSWVFVSNVIGGADTPAYAAVELAERALVDARVLR